MAGPISQEEFLEARQNKSPKKPHLTLQDKYDICCPADESPATIECLYSASCETPSNHRTDYQVAAVQNAGFTFLEIIDFPSLCGRTHCRGWLAVSASASAEAPVARVR